MAEFSKFDVQIDEPEFKEEAEGKHYSSFLDTELPDFIYDWNSEHDCKLKSINGPYFGKDFDFASIQQVLKDFAAYGYKITIIPQN